MKPSTWLNTDRFSEFQVAWEDADCAYCRGWCLDVDGSRKAVLAKLPSGEHPTPAILDRLVHEYELKDNLDDGWAARPIELIHEGSRTKLIFEDCGGEPIDPLLTMPLEAGRFLHLAIDIAVALGKLHQRGLVHKDIKPANILLNRATGAIKLTGFGIASRLPREQQPPAPPEFIAGTLAYMAPEQTGRMNRSIDSRSDLYSLGVTLYRMLTGSLPFAASDPMEWVHCHIARRPTPPSTRLENVPAPLSAIIMKLLAKTAEDRYQTAAALERDLRRCLSEWETRHRIDDFSLGRHDTSDRLMIPEKLYGRENEIQTLLAAFERIVRSGTPEFVLISGYSGIGKSSVVNELHKTLVPPRGFFASGKFDQYKRDVPYATLAQAFQGLVRSLLGKSEAELAGWRDAFRQVLGPNGLLIVDLVPELKLIVGEQASVPALSPQDAQRRFQLVFRRFISVFAKPEHPLALFLDDLQWLDAATLDLLEDLLSHADMRYLMLIGAYRDNEVTAAHPLMRKLDLIKKAGGKVAEITLSPLVQDDLRQLVADALCCEPERAAPLAQLIHNKTGGNPFFSVQFVAALADEALLTFDYGDARWLWDLTNIDEKGYTDNVVDLMVGKLNRLPIQAQQTLQYFACFGNSAETATLSMIQGTSEDSVHSDLGEALRLGLVERSGHAYRFVHDRVREAAYSLIPDERRAEIHLRIGRLLTARIRRESLEQGIFEIVSHFNRGVALITSEGDRKQLAEFNLTAGKRAKKSAAYASALKYFADGGALLSERHWEKDFVLSFSLALAQAECEYLCGDISAAQERLKKISTRTGNLIDHSAVACLQIELYTNSDRADLAIEVALDFFERAGILWSPHPTGADVTREFDRIWRQLEGRAIEQLVELEPMNDPVCAAILDVLAAAHAPANFTDGNLLALIIGRIVNLSIEYGNGDGSPLGYVFLGMILESRFVDHNAGFRFGRLGVNLVERTGRDRFKAYAYLNFGNAINPWTKHVRTSLGLLRTALNAANEAGHLTVAAYVYANLITVHLAAGDPLDEVQRFADSALGSVQQMRFGTGVDLILTHLGLIRALRGLTPELGLFDYAEFDETDFEEHILADKGLAMTACWYWIRKIQACFLAGDPSSAISAASKAEGLLWSSPGFLIVAEYHFYAALARASLFAASPSDHLPALLEELKAHQRQIENWAGTCAENFQNRNLLILAEIARIENRDLDAMHLYEGAIRLAREHGFVHNEAVANEMASRFYAGRGFDRISQTYIREARHCYLRWGANAKVRQLETVYPHLREAGPALAAAATFAAPIDRVDFATVVKVSQAVSSEIVLEKLIDTLMHTAIEHAGAERGLLLLSRGNELRQEAEAVSTGETIIVRRRDEIEASLPETIVHYVMRSREIVILDDASAHPSFSADAYIRERNSRSIMCLPLVSQSKLTGVLYLENNLTPNAFTPSQIAVLKLVAIQAAISLENTYLYRDLAEREAKIRRLVDANIIGIVIWDVNGRIIDANDSFLQMIGYDRSDLSSGTMRWTELTPANWRDVDEQRLAEAKATGVAQPFEKEYFRKDGSRVPVLLGAAIFDGTKDQGVAFVVDLTDRKRAEAAAREVQLQLAHANRLATMGQLTASIAHEVKQPIAGSIAAAQAAMRWLGSQSPDLEKVRRALGHIIKTGHRASDVVDRIRALIKKAPPRNELVDINKALLDVVELTNIEAENDGISVRLDLVDDLPLIEGDRVQLQQVILNLIMNAIEAMIDAGTGARHLLIRTRKKDSDSVLVAFEDSGPGLAPATLDLLFDPFYTTKPGGLGLGLSICRSIIDAHGGYMSARANKPHGAVFEFTLPSRPATKSTSDGVLT